jgi:hypothetical protein
VVLVDGSGFLLFLNFGFQPHVTETVQRRLNPVRLWLRRVVYGVDPIAQKVMESIHGLRFSQIQELAEQNPDLLRIVTQMVQADITGTKRYRFKSYPRCVTGIGAVNWLIDHRIVGTREEAVEFGQVIAGSGLWEHVTREHQFRDEHKFYMWTNHAFELASR